MPVRISGEETVREAVKDYALCTFTSNDVLCCNRVAAKRGEGGSISSLCRTATCSGRFNRYGTTPALRLGDLAGFALGVLGMSSWMTSMSPQMPERHAEGAAAGFGGSTTGPPSAGTFAAPTAATGRLCLRCHKPLALSCGPPLGDVWESTNSWLHVPLLQAAADLAVAALAEWQADPRAADWGEARHLLMVS
ncbi:unnamed protein product [Symbiodinium natans]|uniref:Uncharacterized protein n=1 Tax=Symbiodinium natans TaxID=878477 RepID=A0A812NXN0_9DINO|nr:unnamed protein product [Symbiodinium natans]